MKKFMYTILDEKARMIGPIFLAVADSEAERAVTLGIKGNELMTRYPADFVLLRLGSIDCMTGHVEVPYTPINVSKLDELLSSAD